MPDWKTLVIRRLRQISPDGEADTDIADELTQHLQDRYEDLRTEGLDEEAAVDATLNELSDSDLIRSVGWKRAPISRPPTPASVPVPEAQPGGGPLIDLWRDLRYGARLLARTPALTAVVVGTLALGIMANTTAFSVINTLLLNPLPVQGASELVSIAVRETSDPANAQARLPFSFPNFVDLRDRARVFSGLAGHSGTQSVTITGRAMPERIFAELVTANYFDTLGLTPRLGRFFRPEEDRTPGSHPVLVLGHGPWQRRFDGRADVLGRTIELNGTAFTVIGVAPEGFKGLDPVFGPDVWIPSMMAGQIVSAEQRNWLTDRADANLYAIGRLRAGATVAQADASLRSIARQLVREHPDVNRGRDVSVQPLSRITLMGVTPQLAVLGSVALMAIPSLVLLIACSNVANLLLARASARRHEIGVRLALGAGRARIVRQLLTENMIVGVLSGVVGFGAALGAARLLSSLRPAEYAQNLVDITIDGNVALFAIGLSVLTTLVFGAAPALHGSRANVASVLGDGTRSAGGSRRSVSVRHVLLVGQVALSLMALVTAGLFLRSVQRAYSIDPGFERERLGIVLLNPGQAGYDRARAEALHRTVRDRLGALPGVERVAWASNLPLFMGPSRKLTIEGRTDASTSGSADGGVLTVVNAVDHAYFATAGVTITRGREFVETDRADGLPVAVINEALARRYWPDGNPIGHRVAFVGDPVVRQIVGVAETVDYDAIGEPAQPCVYLPLSQHYSDGVVLYVRTTTDPGPVMASVQRELRSLDPRLDVADVRTARKVVEQALFGSTMTGGLLGVFGLLALALASLGMYGVMAYTVSLRRREVGVRMALGADRRSVLAMVLRDGLTLVGVGLAIGAAGATGLSLMLSSLLHGVGPVDLPSFGIALAVLLAVAALACFFPARRASRLDPLTVLRTN